MQDLMGYFDTDRPKNKILANSKQLLTSIIKLNYEKSIQFDN